MAASVYSGLGLFRNFRHFAFTQQLSVSVLTVTLYGDIFLDSFHMQL